MDEFSERVQYSIIGPPHGDALCWGARIMSLAWVLFLIFLLVLGLANGGMQNPFVVLPLIGLATALAGLRWHLVPAISLTSMGVSYLGSMLLHDPVQMYPLPLLITVALSVGGIVNTLAWLNERNRSQCQPRQRHFETLVGLVCGLPGLALFVLSLWSYSGLGDDCEWGQDSMLGGLAIMAAIVGAALSFIGLFVGMWVFRRAYQLWHEDQK